jgi:hypothetical protein
MDLTRASFKLWTRWLDWVDASFSLVLESPPWVIGMGKIAGIRHRIDAGRREQIEGLLAKARVASKDDVGRLGAQIHQLEARLNELLIQAEEQRAVEAAPKAPKAPAKRARSKEASVREVKR